LYITPEKSCEEVTKFDFNRIEIKCGFFTTKVDFDSYFVENVRLNQGQTFRIFGDMGEELKWLCNHLVRVSHPLSPIKA
jgi:hypothetical protein